MQKLLESPDRRLMKSEWSASNRASIFQAPYEARELMHNMLRSLSPEPNMRPTASFHPRKIPAGTEFVVRGSLYLEFFFLGGGHAE